MSPLFGNLPGEHNPSEISEVQWSSLCGQHRQLPAWPHSWAFNLRNSWCGGFKLAPQREVTTISNFTHKWWSPWKSNADYGTAREKARLFSPFEGLINADINPQLQDKDEITGSFIHI